MISIVVPLTFTVVQLSSLVSLLKLTFFISDNLIIYLLPCSGRSHQAKKQSCSVPIVSVGANGRSTALARILISCKTS